MKKNATTIPLPILTKPHYHSLVAFFRRVQFDNPVRLFSLLPNEEIEENKPIDLKQALYCSRRKAGYDELPKRRLTMESTHSGRK